MKLVAPGLLALCACALPSFAVAESGAGKIHPSVLEQIAAQPEGEADYLIFLKEQADLSSVASLPTKEEKGALVFALLNEVAQRTQSKLHRALLAQGAVVRSFWVANALHVRGSAATVFQAAARAEVERIDPNPEVALKIPAPVDEVIQPRLNAVEAGVTRVNAPAVWNRGFNGTGIVIGGTDTGYRWTHAALQSKYRGWNGTAANHNFNWHDAIHSGGGTCGTNTTSPCDDQGHGTHTMGTMVGSDATNTNQVGVAPGARWIGCRNMNVGVGTPTTYMECLQWFIAPTDLAGLNPTPALAPHVINNSWGCPPSEGCAADTLRVAIESVRAAGIVVVVSAGNDGSACSTVQDPPAIYEASFCVGATGTANDSIASFSSRGPVTVDSSSRLKPNVTAPGVSVRSSTRSSDTTYGLNSGTSMAGPHVAGAVALLLSAHPELIGDPTAVQTLLEQTALRLTNATTCGTIPGTAIPNNTFGWGRIDALAAAGLDDTDGDGLPDWKETLAGTSRSSATSVLRIAQFSFTGPTTVTATFSSISGRKYTLQRTTDPVTPMWANVGTSTTGTGSTLTLSDPAADQAKYFYRVVVSP
ncbi:MAG: S8 family serine peptidase [Verrucomicrobia bacterium]|nr:S8 family serine peptidase [Verrucomicrobiota bacterium]